MVEVIFIWLVMNGNVREFTMGRRLPAPKAYRRRSNSSPLLLILCEVHFGQSPAFRVDSFSWNVTKYIFTLLKLISKKFFLSGQYSSFIYFITEIDKIKIRGKPFKILGWSFQTWTIPVTVWPGKYAESGLSKNTAKRSSIANKYEQQKQLTNKLCFFPLCYTFPDLSFSYLSGTIIILNTQ